MHAMPALPPPAIVAACAAPVRGKVLMHASVDTWDIRPTVDLAQLDQLAKDAGSNSPHRAYGFYKSDVVYAVTAEIGNAAHDACRGPVIINVTMRLTNRHIGIASDIPAGSCRFTQIAEHYRHHDLCVHHPFVARQAMSILSSLEAQGVSTSTIGGAGAGSSY